MNGIDAIMVVAARSLIEEFNETMGAPAKEDCDFVRLLRRSGFDDLQIARIIWAVTEFFEVKAVA